MVEKKHMSFLEISIPTTQEKQEVLIALLSEESYDSFVETENTTVAYIEKAFFDDATLVDILEKLSLSTSFKVQELEDKNWNEEWEKNYDPVFIDEKIHIRASFHPCKGYPYEILITPKMSFGTGHHATTSLVLSAQLTLDHKGKRVLDAGCGTAILSIMAEKRGASKVVAYDCDEWAYKNSLENITLNTCTKTSIFQTDNVEKLLDDEPFDIILANINKNVLLCEIGSFFKRLSKGGILIMSGFFINDIQDIRSEAEDHGFKFLKTTDNSRWATIQFTKLA